MLKTGKLAALTVVGALMATPVFAESKPAATVNGVPIPQARIDTRLQNVIAQGRPDSQELRNTIREEIINYELVAQEAAKQGLDRDAGVVQQIELARQAVLFSVFVQNYVRKNPVGEEQIKQEYENLKTRLGNKEYSVRHILLATESEAKEIIEQLGKKAKFEKLAEKSRDVSSAKQGGLLSWAVPGSFVPQFANAMLNLKKGEYAKDPVQSQFGWHVIKLEDMRDLKVPQLEDVRPQLQQQLQQQSVKKAVENLRTQAKIE